ncbi:hypothetical protein V0288_15730 [Pannus brasiliensis CCIBt3594]|uniref:Uncharacterized protein n=1 Tax=Pannus brasiliensis CCIBt3594 TaxID=1427578 RepID=A0AAW9QVT8_9CHRO
MRSLAEFKNCRVARESGVRSQESGVRRKNTIAKKFKKHLFILYNPSF